MALFAKVHAQKPSTQIPQYVKIVHHPATLVPHPLSA